MKLIAFRHRNLKDIQGGVVPLEVQNFVFGPNGSGKTRTLNRLSALLQLHEPLEESSASVGVLMKLSQRDMRHVELMSRYDIEDYDSPFYSHRVDPPAIENLLDVMSRILANRNLRLDPDQSTDQANRNRFGSYRKSKLAGLLENALESVRISWLEQGCDLDHIHELRAHPIYQWNALMRKMGASQEESCSKLTAQLQIPLNLWLFEVTYSHEAGHELNILVPMSESQATGLKSIIDKTSKRSNSLLGSSISYYPFHTLVTNNFELPQSRTAPARGQVGRIVLHADDRSGVYLIDGEYFEPVFRLPLGSEHAFSGWTMNLPWEGETFPDLDIEEASIRNQLTETLTQLLPVVVSVGPKYASLLELVVSSALCGAYRFETEMDKSQPWAIENFRFPYWSWPTMKIPPFDSEKLDWMEDAGPLPNPFNLMFNQDVLEIVEEPVPSSRITLEVREMFATAMELIIERANSILVPIFGFKHELKYEWQTSLAGIHPRIYMTQPNSTSAGTSGLELSDLSTGEFNIVAIAIAVASSDIANGRIIPTFNHFEHDGQAYSALNQSAPAKIGFTNFDRVLILDEPERSLDPMNLNRLKSFIRELPMRDIQTVIATHSPEIADTGGDQVSLTLLTADGKSDMMRFESRFSTLRSVDPGTLQFLGVRRAIWTRGYLLVEGEDESRLVAAWFGSRLASAGIEVFNLGGDRLAGQAFILPLVGQLERPLFVISDAPTIKEYPTRAERDKKAAQDFEDAIEKYKNSDLGKKAPFDWDQSKRYDCWMRIPFGHLVNRVTEEWKPSVKPFHTDWTNWGEAQAAWDKKSDFKSFIFRSLQFKDSNLKQPYLLDILKACRSKCCSHGDDVVRPQDNEWHDFIEKIITLTSDHAAGRWFPND